MTRHELDQRPRWLQEQLDADEEEREAGEDVIDKHNRRVKKMTFTNDELQDALDEFQNSVDNAQALPAFKDEMHKAIQDLHDDLAYGHLDQQQVQRRVADLQNAVAQTYNDGLVTRRAVVKVANVVDKLCKGIRALEQRHPSPAAQQEAALMKAVYSYLPATASASQVKQMRERVIKSFGARGGQKRAYDREEAARMRQVHAITPVEQENWRRYGRLPDGVSLEKSRGRTLAVQDASWTTPYLWASAGLSPLVFPSLARRS